MPVTPSRSRGKFAQVPEAQLKLQAHKALEIAAVAPLLDAVIDAQSVRWIIIAVFVFFDAPLTRLTII